VDDTETAPLTLTVNCGLNGPLDPAGFCQTVTVNAVSASTYTTANALTKTITYEVCYKNPCVDPTFTSIQAPSLDNYTYVISTDA
jgi:hypothetical protein